MICFLSVDIELKVPNCVNYMVLSPINVNFSTSQFSYTKAKLQNKVINEKTSINILLKLTTCNLKGRIKC